MDYQDAEKKRKARNLQVVHRMRRGEPLVTATLEDTAFPPRPIIRKDQEAMRRLYEIPKTEKPSLRLVDGKKP